MNALFGLCLILLASSTATLNAQCSPDTDAPVISNMPANITGTADAGLCNTNITWAMPTAADNCELSSFTADAAPGDLFAVGITVVTYTAMDEAGNMAAASFTVTITDDEDPVIAGMPSDITLSNDADDCTAVHTWTAPTATDNCGIASITSDYDSGDAFDVGTTTVTYTVTDVNGRAVTASFDVTVTDDQDPSISGTPSDLNQTADSGDCEAVVTWTAPTADDNCSATLSSTHNPGDSFNVGTTTVTYTATDAAGNSVQTSFDVTVTDDEAPSIAQMAGISQTNDLDACGAVVTWADPAVTDNCGNNTLTSDIASGSSFDVGVTEVTYTATDIHGNQSTMSFNVTVTDGQDPTIANMPADISQGTDAGSCSAVVTWTAPSATDNCTLQTLGSDINPGATFQEGTTTVTYTAIDIYGNTTTATFDVTITSTDSDGDGICDNGDNCSDQTACNYADAGNAACILPTGCETCSNATGTGAIVDNDADDDGVCDANEIVGCQDNTACNYNSAATDAGACTFPTGCETCSGATDGTGTVVDNDSDGDGVCNVDEIVGCQDNTACNYNSAATDAGACTYASGACDTCVGGIVVDNDADDDGVCDADEVTGCQDITACNYNAAATDAGPCTFANGACETCENGIVVDNDSDGDGVCDGDEIVGCEDNTACNYNSNATDSGSCTYASGCDACSGATDGTGTVIDNDADDDGVCDANEIDGCTDSSACNYDSDPTTDTDNTLCVYATGCETCSGETDGTGSVVDNDLDNDGVCDADEVTGCTDATACNYDSTPTTDTDNTLCTYVDGVCETCSGATDGTGTIVDNDLDNDGVCDADEVDGCTDPAGCNYNADPNLDSDVSLCVYATGCDTCSGETDGTGTVVDNDADDDGVCDANEVVGCEDAMACNYNSAATDSAPCTYSTVACETCSGETDGTGTVVDNDQDNDGVCNADEVTGCTDPMACNYDSDPTTDTDNTLCTYVDGICETCENGLIVDNDQDNDGVCDANEVTGCTDPTACNYDSTPTTDSDNSLCTYVDGICETCVGGTIVDNDADNDDVCDANEVAGCQDNTACNYNSAATDSDGSCVYATDVCETCSGAIDGSGTVLDNDADNDGVCDANEVTGCTDATACNYDSDPTTDTDNTLCTYVDGVCDTCENGVVVDNDQDNDGVCDADEITGCTDATACNYDSTPTTDTDNTLCTYVDGVCETCVNGSIVDNDADDDGVCDANEITGCTDPMACNYDSTPTTDTDNTLCTYVDGVCETCESGLIVDNDQDNDGVCDANEITGCTDPMACNYDSDPTTDTDNTLCTYTSDPCDTCSGETDGSGTVVSNDDDSDGTCNDADGCPNDPAKTAPGICGCGNVDTDVDNDGVCDDNDLCTDPLANNYQSPLGEECAPCPDAPIFNSILPVTPATTLSSTDGSISLDVTGGTATTLILQGINGAPDYSISLPASLDNLQAGYYQAHVLDDEGCIGVAQTSPGGSTLQQPGIYRELIIPFSLCCSGCGINDSDADGICDDDDNCTDQTACNFDDDCNEPCVYPDGNGDCTGYGDCSFACAGGYLTPTSSNHLLFGDENGNLIGYDISTGTVTSAGANNYDAGGSNNLQLMFFEEDNCTLYMGDSDGFALMDIGTGTVGQDIGDSESAGIWFDTSNGLGFEDLDAGETVDGVHFALSHDGDGYNVGSGNPLFTFEFVLDELYSPALTGFATPCTGCNPDASVTFTKTDYGSEQDAITPNVTIARGNSAGLYNAVTQSGWDWDFEGPQGTYWKWGATSVPGIYSNWRTAVNTDPESAVGTTLSLWIPEGNLFFDVEMLSWTCCGNGGGFSYTRTLVSEPTWETPLPGNIDATLLRMLPKHAANGSDWDWESLAMDLAAGYAYGVCDEDDTDTGYSDQELWRIDLNVNNTIQPTACPTCNPDAVVTFTKPDYSTSTVDQITPNVALARGDNQGYYNAMTQTGYSSSGPEGTYWKWGATGTPGGYGSWRDAHGGNADNQVGNIMSLWIPEGNLFFDIETTSWTCCGDGGGFSYTRTLVSAPAEAPEVPSYDGMEHMGRISDDVSAMIFANGALYVGFENGNIGRLNLSGLSFTEDILATDILPVDITAVLAGLKPGVTE